MQALTDEHAADVAVQRRIAEAAQREAAAADASGREPAARSSNLAAHLQTLDAVSEHAKQLLPALSSRLARTRDRLRHVLGDSLLAAAVVVHGGVLESDLRTQLVQRCGKILRANHIASSANFSLRKFVFHTGGLPGRPGIAGMAMQDSLLATTLVRRPPL